jgi:arylformamidase
MDYIDISMPLAPDTPVWPGDSSPIITLDSSLESGDFVNTTRLEISAHTATHIDAPRHVIAGGPGVESIGADILVGQCHVADFTSLPPGSVVSASALEAARIPQGVTRLLLKTGNSRRIADAKGAFLEDFVALDDSACEWIVSRGIALVGIDCYSITPFDRPIPGHVALLGAGVVVLEGLSLIAAEEGAYALICLPLLIPGSDGAPARAILAR